MSRLGFSGPHITAPEPSARAQHTLHAVYLPTSRNTDPERGDTLIEVIMSMVILSMVIVGASVLMNGGMSSVITGVEHTQVRNGIANQTELLRYIRDTIDDDAGIAAAWTQMTSGAYANGTVPSVANCAVTAGKRPFYLQTTYPSVVNAANPPVVNVRDYSQTAGNSFAKPGQGLWLEAVASSGVTPAYVDFYVRSCWQAPGSTLQQQVSSVVRLHRP